VGVVNNYKEALDIEDIVKVFIIEQRILNLLSLEKKKNFENVVDSDVMISSANNIEFAENSNKKILQVKNDEENNPVFNVRGLI
jgi:hypothetical protein